MSLSDKLRWHVVDRALFAGRQILPGSAHGALPPRGEFLQWHDLPAACEFEYKEIWPASRIPFKRLKCIAKSEEAKIESLSAEDDWANEIRPGFVARCKDARFIGACYSILSESDHLYADLQFPHVHFPSMRCHPIFRHPRQSQPTRFPGRCLVMLGISNLYHFLFESVSRLALAREAGFDPLAFDWILSDRPSSAFDTEIASSLGLDLGRFLPPMGDRSIQYSFDELVFSNASYGIPAPLCALLCETLKGLDAHRPQFGLPKFVYLSRGAQYKSRRIVNERDVEELIKFYGFKTILPHTLTYREQRAIFENAHIIVSAHGAALANLIWCRPGTAVIELRSNSHWRGYWKLYWNISSVRCLNHYWVSCDPVEEVMMGNQYAHLSVPIPKLRQAIENALDAFGGGN